MLASRPSPIELNDCNPRERSRWAAHARLLCGATKRCPVILAVDGLCPPCVIGRAGAWDRTSVGGHVGPRRPFVRLGGRATWRPRTLRALVGPLWLAMSAAIPLSPDAPLPVLLDWLEEVGWIDCAGRGHVAILARLLPYSVDCQRAQLGHLSPSWPRQAPRPFAIQHAYPLLIEKGSL